MSRHTRKRKLLLYFHKVVFRKLSVIEAIALICVVAALTFKFMDYQNKGSLHKKDKNFIRAYDCVHNCYDTDKL